MRYKTEVIERTAREVWQQNTITKTEQRTSGSSEKKYILGMFPYPSGNAHMGHVRVFSLSDTLARYYRSKGHKVLHPLGWDAFGLPAENAAIKNRLDPQIWTDKNIDIMRNEQLSSMGFSFDFENEINTSDPAFYKWTQWLFIKLYENGLVYKKPAWVNWDPVDQTVLANEQVIDGKGWRSGAAIERRKMDQWHIEITKYAGKLAAGIETLDEWSDAAKAAQRNWIGEEQGLSVKFECSEGAIEAFTNHPEFLGDAAAIVVAPEYEGLNNLITPDNYNLAHEYIQKASQKSDIQRITEKHKSGVLTGSYATNPVTGKNIPIIIAEHILPDQGKDVVVYSPSQNSNDLDLADTFNLPVANDRESDNYAWKTLIEKGIAHSKTVYRLRDWAIGRQRYWGCPIPVAHSSAKDAWDAVAYEDLPVKLVMDENAISQKLQRDPKSLNYRWPDGSEGTLSSDTMDTFMCSAWYMFRFIDPKNDKEPFSPAIANDWLPVDHYVGGLEHANQHLIYLRFMSHFLYDIGYLPTPEPVKNFMDNGLVRVDGAKMSKSKGNEVKPDEMAEKYGADALKLFILSNDPYRHDIEWDEKGVSGKAAFLDRTLALYEDFFEEYTGPDNALPEALDDWSFAHLSQFDQTISAIDDSICVQQNFHVAVALLHSFSNSLKKAVKEADTENRQQVLAYTMREFLVPLGIFAPHYAEFAWTNLLGKESPLANNSWPDMKPVKALLKKDSEQNQALPLMINGKPQKSVTIPVSINDNEEGLRAEFLNKVSNGEIQTADGFEIERIIIIKDNKTGQAKRVNFVIR